MIAYKDSIINYQDMILNLLYYDLILPYYGILILTTRTLNNYIAIAVLSHIIGILLESDICHGFVHYCDLSMHKIYLILQYTAEIVEYFYFK